MIVVGMLQQIMTATGVRGLISFAVISTPLILLYILLAVIIPFSEGVLTYGAAAILGIPLIWFFDSIGLHATVVIAGLSLLWPLGDGLPPTALIGRLSVMVSGLQGLLRLVPQADLAALAGHHRHGHPDDRLQRQARLPRPVEHVMRRTT